MTDEAKKIFELMDVLEKNIFIDTVDLFTMLPKFDKSETDKLEELKKYSLEDIIKYFNETKIKIGDILCQNLNSKDH